MTPAHLKALPETLPEALPADLKFETALAELETLAARMESGSLELEDSIAAYQRGMALLEHCRAQLADAEERVKVMEDGVLKPFAPSLNQAGEQTEN